jgi:predicted GIY-YIG superfamily endonuclease
VLGHQGVVETLLVCPHCSHEAHAYFMTQKLARFRTTLQVRQKELHTLKTQRSLKQWRKAKKRHQVEFERLQRELRPLFGY